MIVILEDSFFCSPACYQQVSFIACLENSRHSLLPENVTGAVYKAWKQSAPKDVSDVVEALVQRAIRQLSVPASKMLGRIRVKASGSDDWINSPPSLLPSTALKVLQHPVYVFLENNHADKNFFQSFMSPGERRQFAERCERDSIRLIHGGGLGDLKRQMRDIAGQMDVKIRPYLCLVLIDSDALEPGKPSGTSQGVIEAAKELGLTACYQLARRSIENYLTDNALSMWCCENAHKTNKLYHCLRSFLNLPPQLRYHYNMKKGLKNEDERLIRMLYSGVSLYHKKALEKGFGEKVSECYERQDWVTRSDLVASGGWAELRKPVEQLLAMV